MVKGKDAAWAHALQVEGYPSGTQCKFCDKIIRGGGISRFKKHLAGGDPNVESCKKVEKEVSDLYREILDQSASKKKKNALTLIDLAELDDTKGLHNLVIVKQCDDNFQLKRARKELSNSLARKRSISEATYEIPTMDEGERLTMTVDEGKRTVLTKELEDVDTNNALIVRQHVDSDELIESRKELISGWKGFSDNLYVIGIKQMGELDIKPFKAACYRKYQSPHVADEKALQICSFWQSKLADPSWHPYGVTEELEEDEQLKELKLDLGSEVYDAVCRALMEINEYNASGRCPVDELWNFRENRKAKLQEAINILLKMKKE
ncbi:hypothetical protein AQUCO_01500235v1 [Aquilegia coerulea]|uniref:BED-type domain-containing protein n=1 Tax=Aquilegia coerulea TaxID=218851 RepID=A0A2G5DTF7_AQUCA|nr:hypothetical protein AQUCO_01500235v1 [Aquilegia coerulea]PIA46548.1 hypothetical protein AQUCO_01500235v1 [Aquilegia coerulea]